MDASLRQAAQYLTSTSLSRRVAEWQSKLQPVLEEQESRPAYDIHQYGQKMIQTIQTAEETKEQEKKGKNMTPHHQAINSCFTITYNVNVAFRCLCSL